MSVSNVSPRVSALVAGGLFVAVVCGACSGDVDESPGDAGGAPAPTGIVAGISAESLLTEIETLASDEFEGRAPGSTGETLTVAYLTEQFDALGLEPGNPDGTWVQAVPLVGITPQPGDSLVLSHDAESLTFEPGVDYVAWTKHVVDEVEIDAEFVFVGYGAVAPEYDWNDFDGVDVEGKILLFLVNDPPLADAFGGDAMTYYGRWTYKHEIAAEMGAAGSFVIHETGRPAIRGKWWGAAPMPSRSTWSPRTTI